MQNEEKDQQTLDAPVVTPPSAAKKVVSSKSKVLSTSARSPKSRKPAAAKKTIARKNLHRKKQ
ncbi:hypothetical protein ACXZ1M_26510 [Duganella sp. PWIR1]